MTNKSHVSLEQHICPVCGQTFDTGSILLDKRLRQSMDRHTTTGFSLCPEHQKMFEDGYIALVCIDESKTKLGKNGLTTPENAHRTGDVAHLTRTAFQKMFNADETVVARPMIYIDEEVMDMLKKILPETPST